MRLHRSCGGPTQIWLAESESPLGGVIVTFAAAVTLGVSVTAGGLTTAGTVGVGVGVAAGSVGVPPPPPGLSSVPTVKRPILATPLSCEPLNQTWPCVSGATSYGW